MCAKQLCDSCLPVNHLYNKMIDSYIVYWNSNQQRHRTVARDQILWSPIWPFTIKKMLLIFDKPLSKLCFSIKIASNWTHSSYKPSYSTFWKPRRAYAPAGIVHSTHCFPSPPKLTTQVNTVFFEPWDYTVYTLSQKLWLISIPLQMRENKNLAISYAF